MLKCQDLLSVFVLFDDMKLKMSVFLTISIRQSAIFEIVINIFIVSWDIMD